ncbi:MAG: sigma-70 family RNA polymerase sigma factor [Bacteroidota bacterium]|nr:sigma-70 family RNA polymerase sigma factor [Bacteroidota bacterium]
MLRARDEAAFAYLYDHYSAALMGVIFRIFENREISEDVLQEAFVKIWNNFHQFDSSRGRLFTWMVNLARNLAIDTLRSKDYKKQQQIHHTEDSVSNVRDPGVSFEKFDGLGVRKYIEHLKPDQKQIIDLAYFGGFTQDEIAQKLSIPLGTVKTRMRAAVQALRNMLDN